MRALIQKVRNDLAGRELEHFKDLIVVLTKKEISVRYKNNYLGYAWSVANPLAFGLIYFIAFKVFMRVAIPNYTVFLLAGLFPWQWMANSIGSSPSIFVGNAGLLKKVQFPRNVLVAATVLNDAAHFLVALPVLALFLLAYRIHPSWSWLIGIPALALAQFAMIYGVALGIASVNVFFRDLERITALLLSFLFFLTPIAYSRDMVPSKFQVFLYLNPAAPVILGWRQLFLMGELHWDLIGVAFGYGLVSLFLGMSVYRKLSGKFAEVV